MYLRVGNDGLGMDSDGLRVDDDGFRVDDDGSWMVNGGHVASQNQKCVILHT